MVLLRDVINIPTNVTASDFVVGLADSVANKAETLDTYVVTDQLEVCFDQSLALVSTAITGGTSHAAFLHGSFGSGKSHFMGVLYQVLQHDPDARAIAELGDVIAKHDPVLQGKKILPLTYHLIGASSLEAAILRGYVTQVRAAHPDAPLPAVHRTDALLLNADERRAQEGDERFFTVLNSQQAAASGFGGMGGGVAGRTWDAAAYDTARTQPEGTADRGALVSDLVATMFSAFGASDEYVDLDTGLAVISQHAAALGYDALVLFLDELILWLASQLQDVAFVSQEGAKLAKLVEAQDVRRDIPLISFVSRQRDIAEFLGSHVPGAEKETFVQVFGWSRGRFDDIRLEDRNLPVIAERRLLRPKDAAAKELIDEAFRTMGASDEAMDVLLSGGQMSTDGTGSDREAFRRTYPFSPALVATLVALSQALQRERTALRVMLQLLVNGRDELEVNDLVPVGDLFDVLVDSTAQTVTAELGQKFELARRLYHHKMRRALLDLHQLTEEQATAAGPEHPFRVDDRLVKTLIISALAPEVPALSSLTASRLAALNHGTIKSWLPGQEVAQALQKMKVIASQVSEVHVGEGDDPLITVELTNVDPESVVERARSVDNEGNRRLTLRKLIWESLGVQAEETLSGDQQHVHVWRGRKVIVDLVFGNVRDASELPEQSLLANGDRWKIVVDYPFDKEGQNPRSDKSRVDDLRSRGVTSQTLMWVPGFFTTARLDDLGTLVVLDHLFKADGARFRDFAEDLSPADREQVKSMLRQRRDMLRDRMLDGLKQAYGAATMLDADIDTANALERPFLTLQEGFEPQPPVGSTLRDALGHLIDQALNFAWPEHPRFEPSALEVKVQDARKVLEWCEDSLDTEGGRVPVDQASRALLKRLANVLEVGAMGETHFVVNHETFPWVRRLTQAAAADGVQGSYSVRTLLGYLDQPSPRGLDQHLAGLIVRVFALVEDLGWWRDGATVPAPPVDKVVGAYELRAPSLPAQGRWGLAVGVARGVLGVESSDLLNASTLGRLVTASRQAAQSAVEAVRDLERLLGQHKGDLGVIGVPDRYTTSAQTRALLDTLVAEVNDATVVEVLAGFTADSSTAAARRSIESATQVGRALKAVDWQLLRSVQAFADARKDEARSALEALADAAGRDELSSALEPALQAARATCMRLLVAQPSPQPPTVGPGVTTSPVKPLHQVTVQVGELETALDEVREQLSGVTGGSVTISWSVEQ